MSSEYKRKWGSQLLALGPFSRLSVEAFSDSSHISISRCLGTQSQQGLQGVSHRQNYSRTGLICPHGHLSPHSQSQETRTKGKPPGLRKPRLSQTHRLHSTSQLLTVRVERHTETSGGMQKIASSHKQHLLPQHVNSTLADSTLYNEGGRQEPPPSTGSDLGVPHIGIAHFSKDNATLPACRKGRVFTTRSHQYLIASMCHWG